MFTIQDIYNNIDKTNGKEVGEVMAATKALVERIHTHIRQEPMSFLLPSR